MHYLIIRHEGHSYSVFLEFYETFLVMNKMTITEKAKTCELRFDIIWYKTSIKHLQSSFTFFTGSDLEPVISMGSLVKKKLLLECNFDKSVPDLQPM